MYLEAAGLDAELESEGPEATMQGAVRVKWNLAGVKVCFNNFCALLGTSGPTIRKMIAGLPDLRRAVGPAGKQLAAPQAQHVDFWFYELYQSAAEPLPEAPGPSSQDQALNPDADITVADCPWLARDSPEACTVVKESEVAMDTWSPDKPTVDSLVRLTVASQAQVVGLPARYLPHGKLHDLYWMFLSSWDFVRVELDKEPGSGQTSSVQTSRRPDVQKLRGLGTPSFPTFWRRWQVWKVYLKFRKSSQHAQCQTCFELQQTMHRGSVSWELRMQAARDLRAHYRQQYQDRCIYWAMRHASRTSSDVLCIIIDSMDKTKFAWPRWAFDRVPKSLEGIRRPRMVLTAAIAHGYCTTLFFADEIVNHGSSAFCEVLPTP